MIQRECPNHLHQSPDNVGERILNPSKPQPMVLEINETKSQRPLRRRKHQFLRRLQLVSNSDDSRIQHFPFSTKIFLRRTLSNTPSSRQSWLLVHYYTIPTTCDDSHSCHHTFQHIAQSSLNSRIPLILHVAKPQPPCFFSSQRVSIHSTNSTTPADLAHCPQYVFRIHSVWISHKMGYYTGENIGRCI